MVSLLLFLPFILIIFLVMGLMLIGVATPTESAAIGVIAAIVMAICYRKLTFQMLKDSLVGTVKVSGMILLIIAGSKAFAKSLLSAVPLEAWLNSLLDSNFLPWHFLP